MLDFRLRGDEKDIINRRQYQTSITMSEEDSKDKECGLTENPELRII
jgi:hypothetical protein